MPTRWTHQPPPGSRINRDHAMAKNLLFYLPFNEGGGFTAYDLAKQNKGAITGINVTSSSGWYPGVRGTSLKFDGTNDYVVTNSIDLSAYSVISFSFSMKWTTFADDDHLAFEFSTNSNNNNGTFICDPDDSGIGAGKFAIGNKNALSNNLVNFTRPSAGVWHDYVVVNDFTAAQSVTAVYVDGIAQTLTARGTPFTLTGTYGNFALYLMSRGGASLFSAGQMQDFRIYARPLTQNDAWRIHLNPFEIFENPKKEALPVAAGGSAILKYISVAQASIGKANGVALASIKKIEGVTK